MDGAAVLVLLLPVHHQGIVQAKVGVHHHLAAGHDLHDRGEGGRGQLFRIAGRLGGLGIQEQGVVLPDRLRELHHAVSFDREADLLVLLALERLVERHLRLPAWPRTPGG